MTLTLQTIQHTKKSSFTQLTASQKMESSKDIFSIQPIVRLESYAGQFHTRARPDDYNNFAASTILLQSGYY